MKLLLWLSPRSIGLAVFGLFLLFEAGSAPAQYVAQGRGYQGRCITMPFTRTALTTVSLSLCLAVIALPPGRKHDPAHFDMAAFQRRVYAWLRFFRSLSPAEVIRWII